MKTILKIITILLSLSLLVSERAQADDNTLPASKDLLNLQADTDIASIKAGGNAVISLWKDGDKRGVKVAYTATQYPGAAFPCPQGGWDLSAFTGVTASITNAGTGVIKVTLRVDGNGDWSKKPEPWNAEFVLIAPGETQDIHVAFGTSFGQPGYALDPKSITAINILLDTPSEPGTFIVKSITAMR